MSWQMRHVGNRAIIPGLPQGQQWARLTHGMRFLSITQGLYASQRATSSREKKASLEARAKPSLSPSSSVPRKIASQNSEEVNATKGMEGGMMEGDLAEEERRLAEGDTRLAMRLLMQHHFLYQHNMRRPEEQRIEEERQMLRKKHQARMERIEQKTRNSIGLGSEVSVDGILPLYRRSKGSPTTASASRSPSPWMRLNPVEAEAVGKGIDDDEHQEHMGVCLMTPDMSIYSAEHDERIRSVEVLEDEQKRRREELQSGDATKKLWSAEELEHGGGLTPQRVIQSQLLEDEDQDFAVEAYADSYEE